jgi:excisionase family DNA binding protein
MSRRIRYLTTYGVATLLSVGASSVRRWAARNGMPHVRGARGRILVDPRHLKKWLARNPKASTGSDTDGELPPDTMALP